ncbi:MAG: hypothetical protein ACXU8N_00440 [Telluria sp.]
MSRLRIDFAAPGARRTLYRTKPVAWLLAGAGLLLALGGVAAGMALVHQQNAFEAQLAAAGRRASAATAAPVSTAATRIPDAQAAAVNAAILQLNLPWRDLRDAVAEATPNTIALLALEPDARKRTLKITAEAKDADGMIGYIEELKKEEMFTSVLLLRHETNETDPNRPLRFQVEAQWVTR